MRQLSAMVLQQNSLLKQELDDLKDQVRTQKRPRVEEQRVRDTAGARNTEQKEVSSSPPEQAPLSIENGRAEEAEQVQGQEWKTPPGLVSARRPAGLEIETPNSSEPPAERNLSQAPQEQMKLRYQLRCWDMSLKP